MRGIWLKHNKAALATVCKAMISIEPDLQRRAHASAMGKIAVRAYGIPHVAVSAIKDAVEYAELLLKGLKVNA